MKLFTLLALALLLTACASNDPAVLRGQAASIERQQAKQTAQARAYEVEQETIKQAAVLGTQEAAAYQIELLYAGSAATISAIQAEQAALDLALASRQEAQAAWEDGLRVTQTMQSVQATQTIQPTVIAAAMIKAAANARTSLVISNGAPMAVMLIIVALLACVVILIWYLARRADLSIRNHEMAIEVIDRHNGAVSISGVGAMVFRTDANVIDRAPLNIPRLDVGTPTAPIIFEEPEPVRQVSDPDKSDVIKTVARIATEYGEDYKILVGHLELEMSSSKWQETRRYLKERRLVYKNNAGRWEFVTGARDVLLRLNSPTRAESAD